MKVLHLSMRRCQSAAVFAAFIALWSGVTAAAPALEDQGTVPGVAEKREWVEAMKSEARGPFERILWFCRDGTTQPPGSDGCRDRGGGRQHGAWNERTRILRAQGYYIANILSVLEADIVDTADFRNRFGQILVERFLVGADDGWILRRAMFYRGALQEEGERAGAARVLEAMVARPWWLEGGFAVLRTGAKLLPFGADAEALVQMRHAATVLAERDSGFQALRAKIHGAPSPQDAEMVREYARTQVAPELLADYQALARSIDAAFTPQPLAARLRAYAGEWTRGPWLQQILYEAADALDAAHEPAARLRTTGSLLVDLRRALSRIQSPSVRLTVLELSLQAEREHFRAAADLRSRLDQSSRVELLSWLFAAADAAYGTGLLNARLHAALLERHGVVNGAELPLDEYRALLRYLSLAPGWGAQALGMHFLESVERLAEIEPLARQFIPDQLRASPLLFYAALLEHLDADAGRLAGVRHRLFDADAGFGLVALNPGLARGVLHSQPPTQAAAFDSGGIYLLPETVADLPPVAGILTAGAGNPLSHVQLLARNLGIPNVVVEASLLPQIAARDGAEVVLAVSPGGLVELDYWSARWAAHFGTSSRAAGIVIRPDLAKLDLGVTAPIALDELRASDSGRVVGPKAANLGELRAHFPEAVARGLALPFGLFHRHALQRPWPGDPTGAISVLAWMQGRYRALDTLPADSPERLRLGEAFRTELHAVIAATPIDAALRAELQDRLNAVFGDDLPGLFIRSDTNVEDLPGFTGAGLNLTLPNVVGFEALLTGIPEVWASPFTARSFAWRQALMEQPEHVYTSILLLESVPVDRSGVLITQDIDTGDPGTLSVAVNEGPGGAVDGQAAESLRIPLDGSPPLVLATATAPNRRTLLPGGGIANVPASGSDFVLEPAEIAQLVAFTHDLPQRFPALRDAAGAILSADVEFGFLDGRLRLFQIRPFLDNPAARASEYLQRMDTRLHAARDVLVDLSGVAQP